jgi:hypothetical protein
MTQETKKRVIGWSAAVVGIPTSILITIVFMGGIKFKTLDTLEDDMDCAKKTIAIHEIVLQKDMSLIKYQLNEISSDVSELKAAMYDK